MSDKQKPSVIMVSTMEDDTQYIFHFIKEAQFYGTYLKEMHTHCIYHIIVELANLGYRLQIVIDGEDDSLAEKVYVFYPTNPLTDGESDGSE